MAEHALDQDEDQGLLARWKQTEPLRLWLYGVTVPVLALLVFCGVLSGASAPLWLAIIVAALGVGGGTEVARGFVVSPATARAAVWDAARVEYGPEALHEDAQEDVDQAARSVLIHYRIPS